MGTVQGVRSIGRAHPVAVTAAFTVAGYAVIVGTFLGLLPVYPTITPETSTLLSHATAAFNAATILLLLAGWWWIRQGRVDRHRIAMIGAFLTIMLFLIVYLLRIGGGGTKEFVGPAPVRTAYLAMLAVHILLSIVAVPLVVYLLVTGIAYPVHRLPETPHPRVGRIAVVTWILSLSLGLVTYVLLEHVYAWEWAAAG